MYNGCGEFLYKVLFVVPEISSFILLLLYTHTCTHKATHTHGNTNTQQHNHTQAHGKTHTHRFKNGKSWFKVTELQ